MTDALDLYIEQETGKAHELFAVFGQELTESFAPHIGRYRHAAANTLEAMRRMGVVAECTRCVVERGTGSCCFRGIEKGFDHVLLLANLLMGSSIPEASATPGGCRFLGTEGCRLQGRYYFCVHYLCPELRTMLGTEGCEELLRIVGLELAAGVELENEIRRFSAALKRQPPGK